MSVVIDAGHQGVGFDPGAVGNGIIEADLVLQISLYQLERFKALGVPVKITRTKTQKLTNAQRTAFVKNSGMKHCLSNHINAGGGDGAEVIYSIHSKPNLAQMILDELTAAGQNPRKVFTRKSSTNSRHDYYYMHRDTGAVQTVIVEYGFLDSKKDDVHQLKSDWKLYAEAVVKAYCKFAGYTYKAPQTAQAVAATVSGINSPALKEQTEQTLASASRRKLIVDFAIKQGAHESWKTKLENRTITDQEIMALAMKAIVDSSK